MFSFFKARQQRAKDALRQQADEEHKQQAEEGLQACEHELDRTKKALAAYANSPRDLAERAALLARAQELGLTDVPVVRRLQFLQRLLTALSTGIDENDLALAAQFVAEGERLDLGDTDGVRLLRRHLRLAHLRSTGPQPIVDKDGRTVYTRCSADYKNKAGTLEVHGGGISFLGEVRIDIAWPSVTHVAQTTHAYQGIEYPAVAVQENKRRTATRFVFTDSDGGYTSELIVAVWKGVAGPGIR